MGQPPKTCPDHRGQQGTWTACAVPGCGEHFVKVQGSYTANCPNHRGWFKGKPPAKKEVSRTGFCATCGVEFEKANGMSRYCCHDHNPGLLDSEEITELAHLFGPMLDWPPKYHRYIK